MNRRDVLRLRMPRHVRLAVALLWAAWLISLGAWAIHMRDVRRLDADLYSMVGSPALAAQAVLIYFIGRGSNVARLVVLLAAIPALVVVQALFAAQFRFSPLRLSFETALRAGAIALLLTRQSRSWFKSARLE